MDKPLVYISFEDDYPLWSDIILGNDIKTSLETYFKGLITAIEWSCDKKVKALKLELLDEDTSHLNINKEIIYKVD